MQGRTFCSSRSRSRLLFSALVVFIPALAFAQQPAQAAGKVNDLEWFRQVNNSNGNNVAFSGSYASGYPAPEVQAVPAARANATMARAEYRRAYNNLNMTIRESRRDFEKSETMQDAIAAEKAAWQALQQARAEILRELSKDSEYRAAIRLREDMNAQIADIRLNTPGSKPPSREVVQLAMMKMNYASEARVREQALLQNNPEIDDLRFEFQDASSRVLELRSQFEEELRKSPELAAGREALITARNANLVAAEHLNSVLRARRIALGYAYNFYDIQPRYFRTGTFGFPYFCD
jgi:hypothetical protein